MSKIIKIIYIFVQICLKLLNYLDVFSYVKNLNNYLYLDMSKANSMTSSGQCRLGPLIACIQG